MTLPKLGGHGCALVTFAVLLGADLAQRHIFHGAVQTVLDATVLAAGTAFGVVSLPKR